jgi:hypothetical protein
MYTFQYNIYCEYKVKNKYLVNKFIIDDKKNLVNINKFYLNYKQIFKLLRYIDLTTLQII